MLHKRIVSQRSGSAATLGCLLALSALATHAQERPVSSERFALRVETVASGLEHPWSVAFLPDGRMLVTERPGRMRIVNGDGELSAPLPGLPAVAARGQGGLLDVVLAPDFAESRQVFWSYAERRAEGSGTSVARGRLVNDRLEDVKVIFRQTPGVESHGHFGSRLVFARDGALFVTLGERQARHFAVRAQDLETHFGKIVRLDRDGKALPDNPFWRVAGAAPEIWSYGHRNVQGAALHPQTGELWAVEHGPKGGDELNIVRAGANYGWPLVTHGIAYSGEPLGVATERPGIASAVKVWVPSIATTGLAFYTGDRLAPWRGNVFVGGLYGMLVRLELDGERVVHEERLLTELKERIRDVRQGPDGCLYVLTDSPKGRLLKLDRAAP
ncbi:PQQ-dependent sugar dehydrogenase [Steroidobacter sp. S1-65]|uniref:PQQ-dependent sugar dehydrogenase n=1 Tax=Steroidobacter gossypii TaxID=2805490 RepID=A0ABS1WZ31_9GAMM|nr:PQQ-dependent sugar dehydrogenase [Steroidobacter gossypii]MBM0106238.1 PQQ-dependent sugar dehydrogenase [Steroidobacter gossypii]